MEAIKLLAQRSLIKVRLLLDKLSRFKTVFAIASSGYCAIHWLSVHSISVYALSGALVFGAIAVMATAWLSARFSSPSA